METRNLRLPLGACKITNPARPQLKGPGIAPGPSFHSPTTRGSPANRRTLPFVVQPCRPALPERSPVRCTGRPDLGYEFGSPFTEPRIHVPWRATCVPDRGIADAREARGPRAHRSARRTCCAIDTWPAQGGPARLGDGRATRFDSWTGSMKSGPRVGPAASGRFGSVRALAGRLVGTRRVLIAPGIDGRLGDARQFAEPAEIAMRRPV
jgi:hypothetical protein